MNEVEDRSKKNRNRTKSRKGRLYKLCLQLGDNILERNSFGEVFNKSEEKELGGFSTFKSFVSS